MSKVNISAAELHEHVPEGWYFNSIKENVLQRYWHRRRFEEVKRLIEPSEKVLDIGCADGVFTKIILDGTKAKIIIAIDVVETSIKWARKHWSRNKKMKFEMGDAHKLKYRAKSFDAVFSLEMLEHVFEPIKVLKEIKRVLKDGGYAVFLVPSENFLFRAVVWPLWCLTPRGIWGDTHLHAYRNDYLVRLSEKVGFRVEENKKFILGMLQVIKVRKK